MATTGVDLSISGLASGFDWKSVVTQLANAERSPEIQWRTQQTKIAAKNTAFDRVKTFLSTLQADVKALKDPKLFNSRTAATSNSAVASATADVSAPAGIHAFNITQLATAAKITGAGDVGKAISPDGNLSAITVGTANFSTAITAGTFTVNGKQITIATTDTLQAVGDKISTATSGLVSLGYNATTDKFSLTSSDSSPIVLGSAADTSNFLPVTRLHNNGTGSITSTTSLGRLHPGDALTSANFTTAVTAGAGQFKVNGIAIDYNAGTDNIQNVLDRINASAAGVTASYDSQNDRFVIANKTTGDVGIALEDVTGNFLAASGLAGAALTAGQNLHYTLNGDPQELVSQTNTISSDSSSLTGVTVSALTTGTVNITVGSDTTAIKTAIQTFIKDYNTVQTYIGTQTASSTDATGKVAAGILAGDQDVSRLVKDLRSLSFAPVEALSGFINQLASLGIDTNGKDNTITLGSAAKLDTALADNLLQVQNLFADTTSGVAVQLDSFLTKTIGDSGTLINHLTSLTKQSTSIDAQIVNLEKTIATDSAAWTKAFQDMETAQSKLSQQLSYLTNMFK